MIALLWILGYFIVGWVLTPAIFKFAPAIIDDMATDVSGIGMVWVMWPLFTIVSIVFQILRRPFRFFINSLDKRINA